MLKTGHELTDDQIREGYSRIVKQVSMPRYFYKYVSDLVAHRAASRVIDVGCGNGFLLEEMAQRLPNAELWGIEPAAELAL